MSKTDSGFFTAEELKRTRSPETEAWLEARLARKRELEKDYNSVLSLKAAYAFGATHGLEKEVHEIRNMVIEWDSSYTSSLRRGYVVELFEKHGIYDEFKAKHWLPGNKRSGQRKRLRYLRIKARYEDFLAGRAPELPLQDDSEKDSDQEFAAESDLRDFLAKNPSCIEEGLRLYQDADRCGVEFSVEGGFIDILAIDRNEQLVVIELKVGRGRNKTVGQLLYYMGWVDQNLGKSACRGMIIAKDISDDLILAVKRVPGVSLYRYRLSVSVEPVSAQEGNP